MLKKVSVFGFSNDLRGNIPNIPLKFRFKYSNLFKYENSEIEPLNEFTKKIQVFQVCTIFQILSNITMPKIGFQRDFLKILKTTNYMKRKNACEFFIWEVDFYNLVYGIAKNSVEVARLI